MVKCPHPDCAESGKDFYSDVTMRQHHTKVHGQQLPNCTCNACGEDFFNKGADRKYCDDCKYEYTHQGENNPNYSAKKESTSCRECGGTFEYYPSEKEGVFCPDCVEDGANVLTSGRFGKENAADPARIGDRTPAEGVEVNCAVCGETFTRIECRLKGVDEPVCSVECNRKQHSEQMTGETNPHWAGGVETTGYNKKWREVRKKVYERDNYRCQICGRHESEVHCIHAHHIIPVREFEQEDNAHYMENGVSVCPVCHPKVECGTAKISEEIVVEKNLERYHQSEHDV